MQNHQRVDTRSILLVALFAALIGVGAFIRIPLPVMPFTLQFLFANLAGLVLGRKLGAMAVLLYIALGLVGVPVFTGGGGIGYIVYPTFGYLIGFALGAYVAGAVTEKSKTKSRRVMLLASFLNLAVVFLVGMVYQYFLANYYLHTPLSVDALILYGFVLVVPGDILQCFVCAALAERLKSAIYQGGYA